MVTVAYVQEFESEPEAVLKPPNAHFDSAIPLFMEEDNEVLDWGNEDDEQQQQQHYSDSHRAQKGTDFLEARRGSGDVDDAEDAVSLGGDDDEQDYYSSQRQDSNGNNKSGLSSTPKSATFTQQQQQYKHHPVTPHSQSQSSRELRRENSSNSQKYFTGSGSSPQTTSHSPQRSHSFSKITHALPPKPVVANVPFMHPSHPSIIEATAMSRSTGRDSKSKANGSITGVGPSGKPTSSGEPNTAKNASSDSPLPPDWEVRHPRTGGHGIYYYNVRTHLSTWTRPVSSSSSKEPASGARDRRDSSSTAVGGRLTFDSSMAPATSDHQSPSSSFHSSRPPLDFDLGDSQKQLLQVVPPLLSSTTTLSYEDRHYRPAGGDTTNAADNSNPSFGFNSSSNKRELDSRYAPQQSFTPVVSPQHERFRSLSRSPPPPPQRGRDSARQSRATQRPGRGQHAHLQTDSSQREHDAHRTHALASPAPHWDPLPVEINMNNHAYPPSPNPRRQQRQNQQQQQQDADVDQSFDSFEDRDRPLTRNTRGGRNQNREQSHTRGEEARIREQQSQSQTQNVSAPSHRSPPPHLRRREYDYDAEGESFPVPTPTTASISAFTASFVATTQSAPVHKQRERPTRFDRPAAPVPVPAPAPAPAPIPTTNDDANDNEPFSHLQQSRSSRNHDVYVPGDISIIPLRRGERDRDELTSSAQVGGGDANPLLINKRMRLPSDERGEHTPLPPSERRARGPGADSSAQDTSPPSSEPQSQERGPGQSRRKRQPLPPQSLRFREMSSRPKADQTFNQNQTHSPAQGMASLPLGPGDQQQQQQRPTNNNSSSNGVPSGPRLQPQSHFPRQQPARETNHPDFARGLRMPPSGPSGDADRRGDRRDSVALALPANEMGMDIDVDILPPSRIPSSSKNANNDMPIRAGSGMYADREAADLPKGPRAMASKVSATTSGSTINAASSPTTPFMYPGGAGGRIRERSPPPHMAGNNDSWGEYGGHRGGEGVGGMSVGVVKQDLAPGWRGQDQQGRQNAGHHPMERGQSRREPPQQRGRQNETSRPQPSASLPKLSGTKSFSVGNKNNLLSGAGSNVEGVVPPSRYGPGTGPPPGMSSANMEPMRDNRARGNSQPSKESYERPLPYNPRVSNVDSYRPGLLDGVGTTQHRRSNAGRTTSPPSIFERDEPSPVDVFPIIVPPRTRGRRDIPKEQARFDQPSSHEPLRTSAPRTWRPRSLSPGRELVVHASFDGESNYRAVTPPPLSREPSLVSPSWETPSFTSDRGRPTGRYSDSVRQHRSDGLRGEAMDMDPRQRLQQQDDLSDRGRERFGAVEPRRSGSLEGRLSERYDDRYVEPPHQTHGLPPNPSLRRDHDTYSSEPPRQKRPDGRRRSFSGERVNSGWVDQGRPPSPGPHSQFHPSHTRVFEETPQFSTSDRDAPPSRTSKPVRIRRPGSMPQSRQNEHLRSEPMIENISVHARPRERGGDILEPASTSQQRPSTSRRGASLLDRLSLDHGGDSSAGGMASPSLRERVQIPTKRDRDDMLGGDSNSMDPSFDVDDGAGGDPAAKRTRRRSGKPRRGRRGGS